MKKVWKKNNNKEGYIIEGRGYFHAVVLFRAGLVPL